MKAVVIGATGASGKELINELIKNDKISLVTALVRSVKLNPNPKLNQIAVDFDRLEDFSNEIKADLAFSCMGTTLKNAGNKDSQWKVDYGYQLKFAEICSKNKVPVFVLISSAGANPKSVFFYSRMKGELEMNIKKLNFQKLLIFNPGLLSRPDTDRNGEKTAEKILSFFNRFGLLKKYKPLKVSLLARSMLYHALNKETGIHHIKGKEITHFNLEN